MYVPPSFNVTDLVSLHDFIEQHSFGILVTPDNGSPFASHLPFLLDRRTGPYGMLIGHIARANRQWRQGDMPEVMVVFSGPHAYISPTWYESELVVPTWNYMAVHAHGRLTWTEEPSTLREIVESSVSTYERTQPNPWKLTAPDDFIDKLLQQIVGFRIEITRLEGKWKLNQNHPLERREKVIRALRQRHDDNSQSIAAAMEATLPDAEARSASR